MKKLETAQRVYLVREDINNPWHPYMWEEICSQLGVDQDCNELEIFVTHVNRS